MGYFQPMVIYRDPDEKRDNSIIRYIGNRIGSQGKKNFLCFVTGKTGDGKSYCAISMAEIYSKMYGIEFNPEYHIISSLKELLLLINEPEATRKIKFGSVLVFDEPQVESNARTWQSDINQALGQLISTFRNQRLVIFFACPYKEMVDKQTRILFHAEFKVEGYSLITKMTTVKPRFLEWSQPKGDFYTKRLIIEYKTRGKQMMNITRLDRWFVPLASKDILDVYEGKKKKFTDDLNRKLLNELEARENKEAGTSKTAEFFKVEQLFDKYGEDISAILKEVPSITPYSLDRYIYFIKRSRKMINNRAKRANIP